MTAVISIEQSAYTACLDRQQNKCCGLNRSKDHAGIVCFKTKLKESKVVCVLERECVHCTYTTSGFLGGGDGFAVDEKIDNRLIMAKFKMSPTRM